MPDRMPVLVMLRLLHNKVPGRPSLSGAKTAARRVGVSHSVSEMISPAFARVVLAVNRARGSSITFTHWLSINTAWLPPMVGALTNSVARSPVRAVVNGHVTVTTSPVPTKIDSTCSTPL